jgi:hypothetical protein
LANRATPARVIDLGSDPAAVRGLGDELVAQNAFKAHVTAGELDVGVADPDRPDAQDDLAAACLRLGLRQVAPQSD